jgi:hypothetical protein
VVPTMVTQSDRYATTCKMPFLRQAHLKAGADSFTVRFTMIEIASNTTTQAHRTYARQ